jgi:hypothetical protein
MARMFNALHTSLWESLFLVLVVIPIAFFCILKIFMLYGELP